jgi:tetratricopeptide (TPR) repeat protein
MLMDDPCSTTIFETISELIPTRILERAPRCVLLRDLPLALLLWLAAGSFLFAAPCIPPDSMKEKLKNNPGAEDYNSLGIWYGGQEQYSCAAEAFATSFQMDPNQKHAGDIAFMYGESLYLTGDVKGAITEFKLAEQHDFPSITLHLMLAAAYDHLQVTSSAESEWNAALALDMESSDALDGLSNDLISDNNYPATITLLENPIVSGQRTAVQSLNLALAYTKTAKPEEAAKVLRDGLNNSPGSIPLANALADVLVKLGRSKEAATARDLAPAQQPGDPDPSSNDSQHASPQDLYDQAGKALDAGKTAEAVKLYEELLQLVPDSIEARTNLGAALAQIGRYDEALQQYRMALVHDPQNEIVLLNLSLAYYKQGDFSQARVQLETLHKFHPANQQAFLLLADCDLRLGKFQDAIALVEPAFDARPEDPALEYILGTALIQDGQTQKGATVIDRMMRNGNSTVAGVLVGAAQYAAGEYKLATATLEKTLAANPEIPGAWTLYGRALQISGESDKAKEAFQRGLKADPNDFDACLHMGAILRLGGDLQGAEPYLQHAVLLRPDSAPAQFQIAALQASTGRLDEAQSGFEKLVKQWPDFVDAHLQLALLYSRQHRTKDSERERTIVQELNDKERVKGPHPEAIP